MPSGLADWISAVAAVITLLHGLRESRRSLARAPRPKQEVAESFMTRPSERATVRARRAAKRRPNERFYDDDPTGCFVIAGQVLFLVSYAALVDRPTGFGVIGVAIVVADLYSTFWVLRDFGFFDAETSLPGTTESGEGGAPPHRDSGR